MLPNENVADENFNAFKNLFHVARTEVYARTIDVGGSNASLQLRILRLGLLQDGDVGIGVFPECEEVLVGVGYRREERSRF